MRRLLALIIIFQLVSFKPVVAPVNASTGVSGRSGEVLEIKPSISQGTEFNAELPVKSKPEPKKITWRDNIYDCDLKTEWIRKDNFECIPIPATTNSKVLTGGIVATTEIQKYIVKMAEEWGLDAQRMLRVAECESGFDPKSVNYNYYAGGGHPTGLYQYLPETWSRIGGRSPYGVGNVLNYIDNVNVTMWAWSHGYSGEWACQ